MIGASEDVLGRKRISERRRRNSGTAGALLRAALLFGPLGAALAIVSVIGSWDEPVRAIAPEQVDAMATGSIGPARILPSNRGLLDRPNGGPCLRFPDGSQRGNC